MKKSYLYKTKIGWLKISEANGNLVNISFKGDNDKADKGDKELPESLLLLEVMAQIESYLCGQRKSFDLPYQAQGTDFQKKIWGILEEIPYGETWSYKELAEKAGNAKACRAVGMANHNNPLPLIIPCHRVIGSDGRLVGYAGGLEVKKTLLKIENQFK